MYWSTNQRNILQRLVGLQVLSCTCTSGTEIRDTPFSLVSGSSTDVQEYYPGLHIANSSSHDKDSSSPMEHYGVHPYDWTANRRCTHFDRILYLKSIDHKRYAPVTRSNKVSVPRDTTTFVDASPVGLFSDLGTKFYSLQDVQTFCRCLLSKYQPLHFIVLVSCVGIIPATPPWTKYLRRTNNYYGWAPYFKIQHPME